MNLLYLSAIVPWPASDGDKIRAMVTLKGLARDHRLFGFMLDTEGKGGLPGPLRGLFAETRVVRTGRLGRVLGAAGALLRGGTLHADTFWTPPLQAELEFALLRWPVDAAHVHRIRMMPYAERIGLPYVLDATDCLGRYYGDRRAFRGLRWAYAVADGAKIAREELRWANRAESVLAVTDLEHRRLVDAGVRAPVGTVPNSLDLSFWRFAFAPRPERRVVFLGNMAYPPNQEGLAWFLREGARALASSAPGTRVDVVGAGVPGWLRRLADGCGVPVRFRGFVRDVRPALAGAAALLGPLPVAAGLQNKVVQAMAVGTPAVVTPNVAAALGARDGRELLVSASAAGLARRAARAANRPALRRRLAAAARRFVEKRHSERAVLAALRAAYRPLTGEG